MNLELGRKIRALRKQRNLSQDVLANYLGVSFQAVSRWENETALPDVAMIPAIASFFGVSTDELFNFNLYDVEKKVDAIVEEYWRWYDTDKPRCERLLREGLKKFPGNDVLLNCLVDVIPVPERSGEVIDLCRALAESTRKDDVRFDAWRIMAEAYRSLGESAMVKSTLEKIPELYFTRLELEARLLEGEERLAAAIRQKAFSTDTLVEMLRCAAECYEQAGERERANAQLALALRVIEAFRDDCETPYLPTSVYAHLAAERARLTQRLAALGALPP